MKKIAFNYICVICALLFVLYSCSEDESIIYAEDTSWYEVESFLGTLKNEHGQWVIYPEIGMSPFPSGDRVPILLVENMQDAYEDFKNQYVVVSGKYKHLYTKVCNANLGEMDMYYSLVINTLYKYDNSTTRSVVSKGFIGDFCGTKSSSLEWAKWDEMMRSPTDLFYDTNEYEFKTYLYVIRYSNGFNPLGCTKESIAQDMINKLNTEYSESGISFRNIGSEYIDSDSWNNIDGDDANSIFNYYSHNNAIDIFVFTGATDFGSLAGKAKDIPSTALLVKNMNYNSIVIVHEMGHCLGLYHTHHGTYSGESYNATPELVDGSNSTIAGDYIADTPADPNIWSLGVYVGTGTDANGDSYNPDPTNIMSYSGVQNRFTSLQVNRMLQTIGSNYSIKQAADISTKVINGSVFIGSQGNYSIDVPDTYNVSWEIKCDVYSSYSGGISSTSYQTYTGKSILLSNLMDSYSKKYTLTATYTTPRGYVKSLKKTVYYIALSAQNGNWMWSTGSGSNSKIGYINMASTNNVLEVYRGGTLYLRYTDVTGACSDTYDSDFVFQVMTTPSFLTKASGTNHYFNCSSSISLGTYNGAMQLMVKNSTKIVSVSIKVIAPPGYYTKDIDSLKVKNDEKLIKLTRTRKVRP